MMTKPSQKDQKDLLHFDDLQIGQRFISKNYTVDAEQIKSFASQFDPQPFHLDDAAAEESFFGGLVASGWHTAAISMRLLVETVGQRLIGGLIGKNAELSWPRPTRPGDTLQVECEILDILPSQSKPEWGTVSIRNHTFNQHHQIVQIFCAQILIKRKQ